MEVNSMTWAIFWLWVEVIVWLTLQGEFHGRHGLYFFIGMMVAIALQLFTIFHIWWTNHRFKEMLEAQLSQAEHALEAATDPRNKDQQDAE
jgi:hypothetical protein